MNPLTPVVAGTIAGNVYSLESRSVSQVLGANQSLGCEDMFKVTDEHRFIGQTGGHLHNKLAGFGYIGEGEGARQGEVLIAVRGTNPMSMRDWLTDARAGFCRGDSGHPVHIGFQKTWESFANDIRTYFRGKNPTHIHCVGHSLGGALAALCADYLSANRVSAVSLYTLGAPRVGMHGFASELTARIGAGNIYRISHLADPVTVVPIYPFCHTPYQSLNYVVGGSGLVLNPWAHSMGSYTKAVGQSSWQALLDRRPPVIIAEEVQRWLDAVGAGEGIIAFSADTLAMIGKALGWILREEYQNWGLECANYYTALDHLAHMLERGVRFNQETAEQLKTVMKAILRFLNQAVVAISEITLAFVQHVATLFYSALQFMAAQAVRGMRQI